MRFIFAIATNAWETARTKLNDLDEMGQSVDGLARSERHLEAFPNRFF